jgi:uncharacterized glyoxalase superfamily protein PhnB
MSYAVQVVVDSTDPHTLADWWAETLGWEVEWQDPAFIQRMVDEGHATTDQTTVHRGSLVWAVGAAIVAPGDLRDQRPRILFQAVPEAKAGKNRLHLDVRVGDDDVEEVRRRLVERGATVLYAMQQGPTSWVTMTDPEGNEFCV